MAKLREADFEIRQSGDSGSIRGNRRLKMALSLMAGVIVLVAAVLLSHVTDEKRTQHSATALANSSGLVTSDCAPCADMGADILKAGGSAVDAAVTTLLCNGVINTQSSGIGGGGFMIIRDNKQRQSIAVNYRSMAPRNANPALYSQPEDSDFGRLAVAVPGEVAGLAAAHKLYGRLPWRDLVTPVAELARGGFEVTAAVEKFLNLRPDRVEMAKQGNGKLYKLLMSTKDKVPLKPGTTIHRADYADALDLIAEDPQNFYSGSDISRDIADSLGDAITVDDMKEYKARVSPALSTTYKGWTVDTVPPPAGGVITLHILKLLERYDYNKDNANDPIMNHRLVEAMKFGFASFPDNYDFDDDAERQNFTDSLLGYSHCADVRQRINDSFTQPPSYYDPHYSQGSNHGTSSITVIDNDELYVAATSSINSAFGSAVMTSKYGILLNNDMNEFDKESDFMEEPTQLRPNPRNMIRPGRQPRSSMSPSVFYPSDPSDTNGLRGAVAGVGGKRIITGTVQYLLSTLSAGLTPVEFVLRPRLHHCLIPDLIYVEGWFPVDVMSDLRRRGHNLTVLNCPHYPSVISAGIKHRGILDGLGDFRKNGKCVKYNQ